MGLRPQNTSTIATHTQHKQHTHNADPAALFDDPDYKAFGNLFWPDFWAVVEKKDLVFDMVGLDYDKAMVGV